MGSDRVGDRRTRRLNSSPTKRGALPEINVRQLREGLGMSQPQFALEFGIPLPTLRQWEQQRRNLGAAERTLFTLISMAPDIVRAAVQRAKSP